MGLFGMAKWISASLAAQSERFLLFLSIFLLLVFGRVFDHLYSLDVSEKIIHALHSDEKKMRKSWKCCNDDNLKTQKWNEKIAPPHTLTRTMWKYVWLSSRIHCVCLVIRTTFLYHIALNDANIWKKKGSLNSCTQNETEKDERVTHWAYRNNR